LLTLRLQRKQKAVAYSPNNGKEMDLLYETRATLREIFFRFAKALSVDIGFRKSVFRIVN